ncbi:MAG TPA: glycoside hydrolase [Nitrospirae bacterium]|nr:glycoside hydrolase [Nitrospirota bacterium]HDO25540.1 glycoside hydrolase [Nitrospirota bacterium]
MKKKIVKKAAAKTAQKPEAEKTHAKSAGAIKKQYLKSGTACSVTFRLPGRAAPKAHMVTLVGDFNNWDQQRTPLKRLKNGDFKLTLHLSSDREYRFRYLIDSSQWENDWQADRYIPNDFGCDDSVVAV